MILFELTRDGKVNEIKSLPENVYLSCAFGCFDGVHVGHLALLNAAIESAERLSSKTGASVAPAIWTFDRPAAKPWIISVPERLSICGKTGIKYAICEDFEQIRDLAPDDFIASLAKKNRLLHAVCGYNFRFGKNRSGDHESLSVSLSRALAINTPTPISKICSEAPVTVIDEISALGEAVSSTRIRALINQGDVESARVLLGRPYSLTGTILPGKQLGRTLSRPTANLRYSGDQLVPKHGVYFTLCKLNGECYRSVTNIGYRPTVNKDERDITCEAHILDFKESIYGETVEIQFHKYARGEIAFPDINALSNQITKDVNAATAYFSRLNSEK